MRGPAAGGSSTSTDDVGVTVMRITVARARVASSCWHGSMARNASAMAHGHARHGIGVCGASICWPVEEARS